MYERMTAPRRHQVLLRPLGVFMVGAWSAVPGVGVPAVFLCFLTTRLSRHGEGRVRS